MGVLDLPGLAWPSIITIKILVLASVTHKAVFYLL